MARARLGGEKRRSRSSPARGGGRARCGLPRSASGSAPPCPSTLPRAAALQTVRAESVPRTRRRRVPERGSIPDGGWASESFRLISDPLAVQPCQAKAGWASPGAGPVPLATERATAPHSGQTALRHFAGASWLWAEFAKCPPDSTACPFFISPHNLPQRKSTPFHLQSTICLPRVLFSSTK